MKRSRAYDPLFELDLDDELEDDGGRKRKGRKRPRYSALNGRWRLNEDSLSPEPEQPESTPSATSEQNEDVVMHDTPVRPAMADGGVQTDENDLAPVPSSPIDTPSKTWSRSFAPSTSGSSVPQAQGASKTDSGVQASPSRPGVSASAERQEKEHSPVASNPFAQANQPSGFAAFGLPGQLSQSQGFGNPPSAFGITSAAPSNQAFAQTSNFTTAPTLPSDQEPMQASSLFGTGPVSSPSYPFQSVATSTGFGATSGSVRFGFTHEPQSTFEQSPFDITQAPVHQPAEPYPESSLDQQYPPTHSPHEPLYADNKGSLHEYGSDAPAEQTAPKYGMPEHNLPLWPMGTQNFDSSHAIGHVNAAEGLRTDGSDTERSSPALLPLGVEDGTRNSDEMRQEGLLSQPVYRQGVPQEALPGQEDASVGEEDESMDSDEQAAYRNSEKGDDYDLRNYDAISDDEEGFEEEEPLSDDELLDEGPEHWAAPDASEEEEEEEYDEDEDEYEDNDGYYHQAPRLSTHQQLPAEPVPQKNKIVIDLLSDSDDDETPVPPIKAPRIQVPPHESEHPSKSNSAEFSENESADDQDEEVAHTQSALPPHDSPHGSLRVEEERDDSDAEAEDLGDEDGPYSDEEHIQEDKDESEPESDDEEEPVAQEVITVDRAEEPHPSPKSLHGSVESGDGHKDTQPDAENEEEKLEQPAHADGLSEMDAHPESDSMNMTMTRENDHGADPAECFQTQPDEMVASSDFQIAASPGPSQSSESHVSSDVVMKDASAQEQAYSVDYGEPGQDATASDEAENLEPSGIDDESREDAERSGENREEQATQLVEEEVTMVDIQDTEEINVPMDQRDEPSAVDTTKTTIVNYVETQFSNQEVILETQKTNADAELVLSQPVAEEMEVEQMVKSLVEERDIEMVDAGMAIESEGAMTQADIPPTVVEQDIEQAIDHDADQDVEQVDGPQILTPSGITPEPSKQGLDPLSAPQETAAMAMGHPNEETSQTWTQSQLRQVDGSDDDEDVFHEAPEVNEQASATPVPHPEDSFISTDSPISATHEAEETETSFTEKPKRGGKKTRKSSGPKSAKTASAPQRAPRQSSRQSSRQVSAQQAPSSQRATRSKTMSFQAASPKEDKEDMGIQLARAALKSPTSKKSKVSTTTAKRVGTELAQRLENDLPDCVGLNDLRKYNARFVDVAVIATSANVPPKRTPTREYASSFTVTDPTFAPGGVVEVDLYSLHKDHLPVVKTGDSVLLRGFLVVALTDRGFGLKTRDGSSWAVYKAEGDDKPEMKAAPVEMSDKEVEFMLDVRAWYANLDDAAKGKIRVAVDEVVKTGKESRAKK